MGWKKVSTEILPIVFAIFVVVSLMAMYFEVSFTTKAANEEWIKKVKALADTQIETVVKSTKLIQGFVETILDDDKAITLFKKRDREGLYNYLLPKYLSFKNVGVGQLHFITPDLKSFLRFHKPEEYGDDLSSRKMLVKVIETKQKLTGVEPGIIGLVLRAISPIMENGEFIGIVEAGIIYDESLLKELESKVGGVSELYILYDHQGKLETPTVLKSNPNVDLAKEIDIDKFLKDENYYEFKNGYLYISNHFKNIDNETVALLLSKIPLTNVYAQEKTSKIITIVFSIIIATVLLSMSFFMHRSIKKQLAFNRASENLIRNISESIIHTSSSASEIKSMAENTELATTEVDKALQEFSAYLEESRAETETTINGLTEFTNTIEQITEYTSKLATLTETLSQLSDRITDISDTITVLAINVSIETSKQNIDKEGLLRIAEMIMELSNSARNLAKESKHSLENVENIVASTTLVTEKIRKRISSVRESLDSIVQVAQASTTNVEKIVSASKMAHNSVEQLYSGIEQLEEAIIKIKEEIETFSSKVLTALQSGKANEQDQE